MRVPILQVWLRAQALLWLPGLLAVALWPRLGSPVAAAGGVWIGAMAGSYALLLTVLGIRRLADLVTVGRFVGLLVVLWWGVGGRVAWPWVLGGAVVVVLLDLVDGVVARRFGGSPQGEVLDMETDQCTVLGLSALVVVMGGGAHALVLPALRYGFVLAMWWVGAPAHEPKPQHGDNRRGRRICAAVMLALLFALLPPVPQLLRDVVTGIAVLLLVWSFASDARFLVAHARQRQGAS